mgnify:CR=1 FL=1
MILKLSRALKASASKLVVTVERQLSDCMLDLPGQIWSRVNVRLDRNQGGQSHAQETVYARRDYSTSANG